MGIRSSVFAGTGSAIPARSVENNDFREHEFFGEDGRPLDPESNPDLVAKFQEITGIVRRRWADHDVVASDLGTDAARAALADANIDPETLDYLVVAHNFGDVRSDHSRLDLCPTLAARIKAQLEIRNPACIAYDLPFGCAGWLQGVIQAHYFLRSGDAQRALVVGAETLSRVSDPHDRDSMLYADGAGAAVVEAVETSQPVGILSHSARSDAVDHASLLTMGPSSDPRCADGRLYLKMRGRKVYDYAMRHVPEVVQDALNRAGITLDGVAKVLMHQANAKMDEAILKRLFRLNELTSIPRDIMPMTISWLGNSSVATLPTLFDLIRRGEIPGHGLASGDVLVFGSVGAGMNVNALVYRVP